MEVTCTCGTAFTARNRRARYCSDRCRKRAQRSTPIERVTALPVVPPEDEPAPEPDGSVYAATLADLRAVERESTPLGRTALVLARKLDQGSDTASGLSAAAKQLEATLASAKRGTVAVTGPQVLRDQLAERRVAHGA